MKIRIALTTVALLAFVSVNAQMTRKDAEKPRVLKVECLNENSDQNYMIWDRTANGTHFDCENESGHLGYEGNRLRVPMKLDELYDLFIVDVKKKHNSADFLLRSIEMVETEEEIAYTVHYYMPTTKANGVFKTVFNPSESEN